MAKICKTCGTENLDNAIYCGECGSPFDEQAQEPVAQQPVFEQDAPVFEDPIAAAPAEAAPAAAATAQKEPNKILAKIDELLAKVKLDRTKALIILGAFVATIALIIILVSVIFPSPKAVTKKLMNGIARGDAKAVVNCMPDYLWDCDPDEKEEAIDGLETSFDYLDFDKFTYEIKRISKLDKDEIEDLEDELDDMEDEYDELDADRVTAFREVKIKLTIKIDGEKTTQTVKLILMKYKGQWKVYNFDDIF
jgi:uncharacterized membrane protein YvbJ